MAKNYNNTEQGNTLFHLAKRYFNEKYEIYENIINNRFFIKLKKDKNKDFELINEYDLFIEIQEAGIRLGFDNLFAILKSSFTPKINPIQQYFENLKAWNEKTDFIKLFTDYIEAVDKDWFYIQLKKWMVRVIKCVLNDSYFNKQALIFAQQGQNSGKTTLCRFFCPKELNEYKKEHLDNLKNKDTKIELARNFLINLDELAILNKADDVKSLKSLMTTDFINERLPYGKSNVTLPRRCSFVGSTDNFDFLKDKTGNVRWLVIELKNTEKPINFDYSKNIDINDMWSQAYHLSKDESFNEQMTNSEIRANELNNEKYFVPNIETEIIRMELKQGQKDTDEFMTAHDILEYLRYADGSKYFNVMQRLKPENIGHALSQLKYYKTSGIKTKDGHSTTLYGYYIKKLNKYTFS